MKIRIVRRGIITLDYSYVRKRAPSEVKELLDKIEFQIQIEKGNYLDATIELIGISPMFREVAANIIPPHYDFYKLLRERGLINGE